MSEYKLLVISTACGVIGAFADVAIVVLMIRGEPQRTVARRRYWPWLLAMLLITLAAASPAYLTYRLAMGTLPIQPPNPPSVVSPLPTSPSTWDTPPSAQGGPIGPILAIEFVQAFDALPKPCKVMISAPQGSHLRETLYWLLNYGGSSRGPGGTAVCEMESPALSPQNVDEPNPIKPNPETGIIIHWDQSFTSGEQVAHWFDADGFNVRISHHLPNNSPSNLIWIDIGPGNPWKY
jgi:hypothetical protein